MTFRPFRSSLLVAALAAVIGLNAGCPFLCPECQQCPEPNTPDANEPSNTNKSLHEKIFTEIVTDGYKGTSSCIACHSNHALDLISTGHWYWSGTVANIEGVEGETHGKIDLINNFCIAVPSNEGRCTQCHPSYGWQDNTFDFESIDNIDCLVCHDTTGTYKKNPSANGGGGPPSLVIDGVLTVVGPEDLQNVAYNVGKPVRGACLSCHANAGGGDNVKHGDLSTDLTSPTEAMDYHMGGLDFTCQQCHTEKDHGIAGFALHSVDEGGASPDCTRCHGEKPHGNVSVVASLLDFHARKVACQTCHIPTFARTKATVVEWYWDEAGQDIDPVPNDEFGLYTYDKKKGSFVHDMDVRPSYMWYDGKWTRKIINVSDTYDEAGTTDDPVVLAMPTATKDTEGAKIYPFKKMIGRQPVDTTAKRLMVPHLFGTKAGANPYWAKFDWGLAIADGAAYAGQPFSGDWGFANTVMYLTINHEVAPASEALDCSNCHGVPGFFESLGYDEDPFDS